MKTIWIISDDKPGHLNQSLGLAEAIQRQRTDYRVETLPALSKRQALWQLLAGKTPSEAPALIIGAGHRTHLTLLAYGKTTTAPTVVMMKPSLPKRCFDLCIIPAHDQTQSSANQIVSAGALNRMQPGQADGHTGMILIGGPSKHFGWDDQQLLTQLKQISQGELQWTLTTSRRTPDSFTTALQQTGLNNITLVPYADTAHGWLAQQLPNVTQCWVSADSVSMVYEALTAGCAVGLLDVPQTGSNRISAGLDQLVQSKTVQRFVDWDNDKLAPPAERFNEAERCAALVIERFSL